MSARDRESLRRSGTFASPPRQVDAPIASSDFFDLNDRVQVNYELLRARETGELSMSEACRRFSVSRTAYYRLRELFARHGVAGLMPRRTARHKRGKLTEEHIEFLIEVNERRRGVTPARLAALLNEEFGVRVHRTTVMRALRERAGS